MTPSRPFIGQTTSPGQKNVADAMEGYYTHTTQGVLSTIFMARCSDCLLRPTSERGRKALAYSLEHVMPVPHQRGDARLLLSHKSTLCPSHIREEMQGSCSFTRARYARPTSERGCKALAHSTLTPGPSGAASWIM